jgi:hypothetical protein
MGSGYSADAEAALACRIKFWTFAKGSLSFIPAFGYFYSHLNAFPKYIETSFADNGDLTTLSYTRPIQQDWFGPTAEGRIAFSWKDAWRLDGYYQYRPVDFRITMQQSIHQYFFNPPGTLGTANDVIENISSYGHTTRTHLGGLDFSYRSSHRWQLGAHFDGSETWSKTAHNLTHDQTDTYLPVSTSHTKSREKLNIHWTRYNSCLFASYWY